MPRMLYLLAGNKQFGAPYYLSLLCSCSLSRHPLHFCVSERRRRRRERSAAQGAIWRSDNLQVPQNCYNCSTGYSFRDADFHIPRFHSETYGKHSLRYLGPKLWNSLPSNLRNLPPLQSVKRQIRLDNLSLKLKSDCENCVVCSN